MTRILLYCIAICLFSLPSVCQSFELMPGNERLFVDVQWLKFISKGQSLSIFSRTRATLDYKNNSDLFSGSYLNYTLANGLGGSLVGSIGSNGGNGSLGFHFFKAKPNYMFFGLASSGLRAPLEMTWFSIFRITPKIDERWKTYISLENFNLVRSAAHLFAVQRIRIGLDYYSMQFGFALNLSQDIQKGITQSNIGVFTRKSF